MQRSAGEPHFSHGRDSDFRCAQKSPAVQGTVSKNLCCSFKIIFPHQSYIPHRSETGCRPWLPNKRSSPKDQSGAFGGLAQVCRMNNPWTGCPALRGVRSMGTTAAQVRRFSSPASPLSGVRSPQLVRPRRKGAGPVSRMDSHEIGCPTLRGVRSVGTTTAEIRRFFSPASPLSAVRSPQLVPLHRKHIDDSCSMATGPVQAPSLA